VGISDDSEDRIRGVVWLCGGGCFHSIAKTNWRQFLWIIRFCSFFTDSFGLRFFWTHRSDVHRGTLALALSPRQLLCQGGESSATTKSGAQKSCGGQFQSFRRGFWRFLLVVPGIDLSVVFLSASIRSAVLSPPSNKRFLQYNEEVLTIQISVRLRAKNWRILWID